MTIEDYTNVFVEMLLYSNKWDDFAPTFLILADRGQGKTGFEFEILTIILTGDEKRKVKFYRAPPKLLEEIEKSYPPALAKRFSIIDDIWDIEPNDILAVDEAGHVLNAKLALTKALREIESGITFARHNHIPVVLCSALPKIISNLNIIAEFKIYKHMGYDFVNALIKKGDEFVKRYSNILQKIPIHKALFRANYKYFNNAQGKTIYYGGLVLPMAKYCPWFTEGISQNMQGTSMAIERSRDMELKESLDFYVDEVVDYFGKGIKKGNRNALIRGYFLATNPEVYQKIKNSIGIIGDKALFKIFKDSRKIEEKKEEIEVITENFTAGLIEFSDFQIDEEKVKELIKKNKKWHNIERDLTLFSEREEGKYLKELCKRFRMNKTTVSMAIKKVAGAVNYYQGKLFEDFIENQLKESKRFEKVIKEAKRGEVDIKVYSKDNKLFIYSLKNLKIDYSPFWLNKEELKPELQNALLCKLDYETHLILLIYDNFNKKIKQFEINYDNPINLDISK